MSWADNTATWLYITAIALLAVLNFYAVISLRRRATRAEINLAVLRVRVKQLERDVSTVTAWVSPNHQLPPHIKRLDFKR